MKLIEIDKGVYVKVNDVLFVLNNLKTKTIKLLKENAKKSNELTYFETKRKEKNSVVVLKNGDVFVVNYNIDTIVSKCTSFGVNMLDINDDYFVNIFYIKALFELDSEKLSNRKKLGSATDVLQFVHQGEKRKSFIVLHNNVLIYLSKSSDEILKFADTFNNKMSS